MNTDKGTPSEPDLREAFRAHDPRLEAELSLGENNPDFRGLEDLNARHAWRHFEAGYRAALPKTDTAGPTDAQRLDWLLKRYTVSLVTGQVVFRIVDGLKAKNYASMRGVIDSLMEGKK